MDPEEYRIQAKQMVDYVADYMVNIRQHDVVSSVVPGYLQKELPTSAPLDPMTFDSVMTEVKESILPGVTHWLHPNFYAFYPTAFSYPSMLGSMLSDCFACIGFNWYASPACTELEVLVLDWMAKAMGMPEKFLSTSESGGGAILSSASEATLMILLVARNGMIKKVQAENPNLNDGEIVDKMRIYFSKQAHSSVERACKISLLKHRFVTTHDDESMDVDDLVRLIKEDREKNLYPIMVICSCGSTLMCSFDNLYDIGRACIANDVKCHVDAAYAGSSLICPEFRHLAKGVELVNSFCFNPHKILKTHFDCSILWTDDRHSAIDAFSVYPVYLSHDYEQTTSDLRHLQIPQGRRFRALKLWFVLNMFGIKKLQEGIHLHVKFANVFADKIKDSGIFELVNRVDFGLVCFRMKRNAILTILRNPIRGVKRSPGFEGNERTFKLHEALKLDHSIFLSHSVLEKTDTCFLRFVCGDFCTEKDVIQTYEKIKQTALKL